jgi:hypothetical protein
VINCHATEEVSAYEDNRHYGEDHNRLSLHSGLLALLSGLICLNHTGLLLFEADKLVNLDLINDLSIVVARDTYALRRA